MTGQSRVSEQPSFGLSEAVELAKQHFGLTAAASELPSERDQNFLLQSEDGARYVLKIANPRESREILQLENRAMARVADAIGLAGDCPRPQPSQSGEDIVDLGKHQLRLLSYVEGRPLGAHRPHDDELLCSLGAFLARMDLALAELPAPGKRDLPWDPKLARGIIDATRSKLTQKQSQIIDHFAAIHASCGQQLAAQLRQLIHNDANDYNVIVGGDPWRPRVVGLIDYGDMIEGSVVVELAVACAYVMLDKPDPVAAAATVVAGYHQLRPLSEDEISLIFPVSGIRLAMSVCNAVQQTEAAPGNDYLRISEDAAWHTLSNLRKIPRQLAEYKLRSACGLEACPDSPRLRHWLEKHGKSFAPVLQRNLAQAPLVLDLSIGSPELSAEDDTELVDVFSRIIETRLAAAGTDLALGRYDEARGLYRSDVFAGEGNDFPERRSLHLGVDLFMPAGTPVHAPIEGMVHSLQENAADLDYGPTIILEHVSDEGQRFYTLYGHLSRESLEDLNPGDPVDRGQRIAWMGAPPVNGNWPPHLHFQVMLDMLEKAGDFPGVARPSEAAVWLSICPDPNLILNFAGLEPGSIGDTDKLRERRTRLLGPSLSLSYQEPLHILRGSGASLYDSRGQAYLDLVNNVCHVGHCHPRVVRAGREQMGVLNTNTRYLHEKILDYAERLTAKLPDPLAVAFLVCSGSEANELALRMARCHSGSDTVLVLEGAYHGNSQALVDASPYKHDGPGGRGRPNWVHTLAMPDPYRGRYRGEDSAASYLREVRAEIAAMKVTSQGPGAVIAEPILGCGGQVVPPAGYLSGLFREVREAGGVCIADEVQVGFGRVGSHFWAFETQGVIPDIVTLGKPIGNGHPLGAVVTTREIADSFANGMEYFNTFGGNPVSAAIGLAVLDVIEAEGLQEHAQRVGGILKEGLLQLARRFPLIGDVRGHGLFLGVDLVLSRDGREAAANHAAHLIERLKARGILLSSDGPEHNVLKFKPPMVISEKEVDRVLSVMADVLAENALQVD